MIQVVDFDTRALAPVGARGPDARNMVLARVGRWARFARLCGVACVGAVGRFSSMRDPGALEALQGVAFDDEGCLSPPGRARVLPGGALTTDDGVHLVVLGPPRRLVAFASAFRLPLFATHGHAPSFATAIARATDLGLISLAWTDGASHDELFAVASEARGRLHGLLVGPEQPAPRTLARVLGCPVVGASRALRRAEVGARLTGIDCEELSFDAIRRALACRLAVPLGGRGVLERTVVRGAASLDDLLRFARGEPAMQ